MWKSAAWPVLPSSADARVLPPGRSCPLNHRAAHRSYPQLWRSDSDPFRNRPVWPSDPAGRHELHACKLPTVWITPVDNSRRGHAQRIFWAPGDAGRARTGRAGHGALWKTGTRCRRSTELPGKVGIARRPGSLGLLDFRASRRRTLPRRFDAPAQLLSPSPHRGRGNPGFREEGAC